jgi:endoglucanase
VAVDVTYGTCPYSTPDDTLPLGGGVCINKGPDCHRGLTKTLIDLAELKKIPHQIEITCGLSRTNATHIQTVQAGIPTAVLSVGLRYMHTPAETLSLEDIDATARLLKEWVMSL